MGRRYPELQRASRILEVVSRISARPRMWTRGGLANNFEVSERQITKDLDVIRHGLKLDLRYERGGGYYFETIPSLPAVSYSLSEALAIYLAAEAGRRMTGTPGRPVGCPGASEFHHAGRTGAIIGERNHDASTSPGSPPRSDVDRAVPRGRESEQRRDGICSSIPTTKHHSPQS
jgi:hypothetical protein